MSSTDAISPPLNRAAIKARAEVVAAIKAHHKTIGKAWRDFQQIDADVEAARADELVARVAADLRFHAAFGRAHFYPALRASDASAAVLAMAEVEHQLHGDLLDRLQQQHCGDDHFAATFELLCELLVRHVKRQQADILPLLRQAPIDWPALAGLLRRREADPEPWAADASAAAPADTSAAASVDGPQDSSPPAEPIDDTIEPRTVPAVPDTPAERRAAAHGTPIK